MLEVRNLRLVYPNGYEALRSVSMTVRDGLAVRGIHIGLVSATVPTPLRDFAKLLNLDLKEFQ